MKKEVVGGGRARSGQVSPKDKVLNASFSGAGSSIDKRHFAISHRAIVVVFIFSHVRLFARESDRLSRPEYWSGEPFHSPGDLPHPGIEPRSPALQADSLPAEPQGKPWELANNFDI